MASDESRHQGDGDPRSEAYPERATGPITVDTTDPAIESVVEHQADWKAHPDTTVRVETTQVAEPSPLYVSGVRTVVVEDRPHADRRRSGEEGRSDDGGHGRNGNSPRAGRRNDDQKDRRGREKDQDHDDRDDDEHRDRARTQQQPSTMKNLLITAGVGLLAGVIGAMGYSYFFGSKSEDSSKQNESKNESSQKKSGSSKESGGGSGKESGKESNAQASTSDSIPDFTSAQDADTLKKQIMDLMHRVDRVNERVDRVTRPKDETPPVLHTLQIKIGELAREMDELASLPAKVRHYDNRFETLREEVKTLRARIESRQDGPAGTRMSPGVDLPSIPSAGADDASLAPTMELGIGLLQRGQYASAREVFLRLQAARPDDARIWYLSAMAEGLTSGDWDGQAMRLAKRGLECERAGHPSTAQIDAALATRSPIKGEQWIASLRRRVLSANRSTR